MPAKNPAHGRVSVATIVGTSVGSFAAVAFAVSVIIYWRRRRRARELPVRDDTVDIIGEVPSTPRTGIITEPFMMPASLPEQTSMKESYRKRNAPVLTYQEDSTLLSTSDYPRDAVSPTPTARSASADSGALYALERRVDSLMQALAVHTGDVEGSPPEYEGDDLELASDRGDRA